MCPSIYLFLSGALSPVVFFPTCHLVFIKKGHHDCNGHLEGYTFDFEKPCLKKYSQKIANFGKVKNKALDGFHDSKNPSIFYKFSTSSDEKKKVQLFELFVSLKLF